MPNISDIVYSRPLTEWSLGYTNPDLIGEQLFPVLEKNSRVGFYYKYGKEIFRAEVDVRAPGSRANEVRHDYQRASYLAIEHALNELIPWEIRDEAAALQSSLDPYQDAADIVTGKIALGREIDIANTVRNVANYPVANTESLAGTAQWSYNTGGATAGGYNGPNILDKIMGYREVIRSAVGQYPNTAVIPAQVMRSLRFNPLLLDKMAITGVRRLTSDVLKDLFEVDTLLVAGALSDTANLGQAANLTDVWGKDMWLGVVAPRMAQKTVTFGATIRVRYASGRDAESRQWTELDRKSDVVEVGYTEARVLVAPEAGFLVKNAVI